MTREGGESTEEEAITMKYVQIGILVCLAAIAALLADALANLIESDV